MGGRYATIEYKIFGISRKSTHTCYLHHMAVYVLVMHLHARFFL